MQSRVPLGLGKFHVVVLVTVNINFTRFRIKLLQQFHADYAVKIQVKSMQMYTSFKRVNSVCYFGQISYSNK